MCCYSKPVMTSRDARSADCGLGHLRALAVRINLSRCFVTKTAQQGPVLYPLGRGWWEPMINGLVAMWGQLTTRSWERDFGCRLVVVWLLRYSGHCPFIDSNAIGWGSADRFWPVPQGRRDFVRVGSESYLRTVQAAFDYFNGQRTP